MLWSVIVLLAQRSRLVSVAYISKVPPWGNGCPYQSLVGGVGTIVSCT